MATDLLPDSRTRAETGRVQLRGLWMTPVFCANCGVSGGLVPEAVTDFAFYLCTPCSETWGAAALLQVEPTAERWRRWGAEFHAQHQRYPSEADTIAILENSLHPLYALARETFPLYDPSSR